MRRLQSNFHSLAAALLLAATSGAAAALATEQSAPSDAALAAQVTDRLMSAWGDTPMELVVVVEDGVVTVRGAVRSDEARREVLQQARAVTGVRDVVGLLVVREADAQQGAETLPPENAYLPQGAPAPAVETPQAAPQQQAAQQQPPQQQAQASGQPPVDAPPTAQPGQTPPASATAQGQPAEVPPATAQQGAASGTPPTG